MVGSECRSARCDIARRLDCRDQLAILMCVQYEKKEGENEQLIIRVVSLPMRSCLTVRPSAAWRVHSR
jgi:hypothetical protein